MQIASLLKLLNSFADFLESIGRWSDAQNLKELRGLFLDHEGGTVVKVVGALIKRKPRFDNVESDTINNVRDSLFALQNLLMEAECRTAANDISRVRNLLEGCQHSSISEFVADVGSWSTRSSKGPAKGRGRTKDQNPELSLELVASYIDKLRSSESRNEVFDQVMQSLRVDRGARANELREIASGYLGFQIAKKEDKKRRIESNCRSSGI